MILTLRRLTNPIHKLHYNRLIRSLMMQYKNHKNTYNKGKSLENNNARVAMRAVAKAADLPRSFAQPFCNLWLGQGAHLVHYPINCGKDVNLVLTLDSKNATSGWQQRYLEHNAVLSTLCENRDIKWIKTVLSTQTFQDCWSRVP